MQVDNSMEENLYFAYYYAASASEVLKINVKTDKPAISGTAKPIVNTNGTFYALGLKTKEGKSFKPGFYVLAFFSEDQSTLYGIAECQVLPNSASSYK